MPLETIYYVSQSASVVAIIGSLLFVGFQVRQSRLMERAKAQREILARVSAWTRSLEEDNDTFIRCLGDYASADAHTQIRFHAQSSDSIFIAEAAFGMHKDGFFTEGTWQGIEGFMLALLRTPGGAQWWPYAKHTFGPHIVEHLEKRLAEFDPSAPNFLDMIPAYKKRLSELAVEDEGLRSALDAQRGHAPNKSLSDE